MATLKNTTVNDTGYIQIPSGTYAERPTPSAGMMRYNTDFNNVEYYNNYRWMDTNFGIPDIITDGLQLYVDAGNNNSYPGSGTSWTDLSGNGNNGTLVNGPTYDTENGGNILCDGVNDYITYGNVASMAVTPASSFSLVAVFEMVSNPDRTDTTSATTVVFGRGSMAGSHGIGWSSPDDAVTGQIYAGVRSVEGTRIAQAQTASLNTVYIVTLTYSPTYINVYVNGNPMMSNISTTSLSGQTFDNENWLSFKNNAVPSGNSQYGNGKMYSALFYNRELSKKEFLQTFEALRGKYGV